jgi:hypothetical protein
MHGLGERRFIILPLNWPSAPEKLIAGGGGGNCITRAMRRVLTNKAGFVLSRTNIHSRPPVIAVIANASGDEWVKKKN